MPAVENVKHFFIHSIPNNPAKTTLTVVVALAALGGLGFIWRMGWIHHIEKQTLHTHLIQGGVLGIAGLGILLVLGKLACKVDKTYSEHCAFLDGKQRGLQTNNKTQHSK